MTSIEAQTRSETEEVIDNDGLNEVVHDEIPEGSSPEEVFQTEQLLDHFPHPDVLDEHYIPLNLEDLKHGEEIVEEHGNELVEEQVMGEMLEEHHHIPNPIVISPEDLFEAGIDADNFENLTEEQINLVIQISQRKKRRENGLSDEMVDNEVHNMMEPDMVQDTYISDENNVAIILTNDGGVKITDVSQQEFYFSPSQLQDQNINVNNLTDENVQQLVQMAMSNMGMKDGTDNQLDKHGENYGNDLDQMPSTSYHNQMDNEKDLVRPAVIGDTVQIRLEDGTMQTATIRYVRGDSDYKVQFDDGSFAYASGHQFIYTSREQEGYQSPAPPVLVRRHELVRKRPIGQIHTETDMRPPVLKRSHQLPTLNGNHAHNHRIPNFCCPICDQKVYQKEPSYIVIRLPACDSCTREKIIVLDEPIP